MSPREGSDPLKKISCPSASVVQLQISSLNNKITLGFKMNYFKCIFTYIFTGENDQKLYLDLRGSGPTSISPWRGNLYRLPLLLVVHCFQFDFGITHISFNFKTSELHDLRSGLPTVPLCSRDGDGCHSERTAAQWLGVRPGYPQVRDGSVLKWIVCATAGNIDILARYAESHCCPTSWNTVVSFIPALQPIIQWH